MNENNETLETAIKRAALSGFTVQQTAGETEFPYRLIGPAVTREGLAEVLDMIDQHGRPPRTEAANVTTRGQEPCPGQTANELLAMLDMLLKAASESDLEFLDDTLESYAITMIEKAGIVSGWFSGGGVERIMGGAKPSGNGAEAEETAGADMAGIARNIRMVASQHSDPKVRQDGERIASEIEREGKPAESEQREFDDEHYLTLAGIIGVERLLFREINEPEPDNKQSLEDLSCALDALVDDLARALGRRGMRADGGAS